MPLDPERIDELCRLARLRLAPGERELFARQLDRVLAYLALLEDVEDLGEDPAPPGPGRLRPDTAEPFPAEGSLLDRPRVDGRLPVPPVLPPDA